MNKKTILIISLLFLCVFITANFAFAENRDLEITYSEMLGIEAPDSGTSLPEFIKFIFNLSVALGGLLGFGALIYGGIKYITSAGSAQAISDARAWIGSGIGGLFLLLSVYIVLTTINPNLVIFKEMVPLQSNKGICLCETSECELPCSGEGKKYYTIQDIPKIDISKFEAKSVRFITAQDEITSIFLFAKPNFVADDETEIIKIDNNNDGGETISSIPIPSDFIPASISFLKNKPGIYLYEEPNFCESSGDYICLNPPIYISATNDNLSEYKATKSIKIIHPSDEIIKQTLLFSETGYKGVCSPVIGNPPANTINNITLINDLSTLEVGGKIADEKYRNLSSLQIFTTNFSKDLSEATIHFYDSIDCDDIEANKFSIDIENSPADTLIMENFKDHNLIGNDGNEITEIIDDETKEIDADKKILSFKIEMKDDEATYIPYTIILATRPLEINEEKNCQTFIFEKPYITNCIPTLKATSIYDPDNENHRPSSFYILSTK